MINNIIARNQANSDGGGIYIDFFSTPSIINNTIATNNPQGIFLFNSPSPIILNNNIVSHTYGIWGMSPTIALDYNNVWNCSINCYFGVSPGPNDLSVDPRFLDPARLDYHLQVDSPVIDAGTNSGAPGEDFEGDFRPLDGNGDGLFITDIGADEYSLAALEVSKQAIPSIASVGGQLTYTIYVTNTGNVTLMTTITDILPVQVTPTNALTWLASIAPGNTWTEKFVVTVTAHACPLINKVMVTILEDPTKTYIALNKIWISGGCHNHLPLIIKD